MITMTRNDLEKLSKDELIDLLLQAFDTINTLTDRVNKLEIENALLRDEIKKLKGQMNQNSQNSSKPPSSDGYKKPKPKSLRKSTGRKPGGQPGHTGHGLALPDHADEIEEIKPTECWNCETDLRNADGTVIETRYKIDIPVITARVVRLDRIRIICPECGVKNEGVYPDGIDGAFQYGENLKALAVTLVDYGMVSVERTREIITGAFGVPISTGTIQAMVNECAERVKDTAEEIKNILMRSEVAHFDETGFRVAGVLHWLHSASNALFTYMTIHQKRGVPGIDNNGVLTGFTGRAIHDCFSSYFQYLMCLHALCNAHLLRELQGVFEETGQAWCNDMSELLISMKESVAWYKSIGKECLPMDVIQQYYETYEKIIADGIRPNPLPVREPGARGKLRRGKARCLLDRLELHRDKYLCFIRDFRVPFDNNQAERDIRIAKVKQKVSGGLRSIDGANAFAFVTSFIQTAKKQGVNIFSALRMAFLGLSRDVIAFSDVLETE